MIFVTPLYEVPKIVKFIDTQSRMVVLRAIGSGELVFNGYKISFGEDKQILETDGDDGCTTI